MNVESRNVESHSVETLRWREGRLELIDQRKLPLEFEYVACDDAVQTAAAIRDMVVRGAPAIGCTAAYGVAVEAQRQINASRAQFDAALDESFRVLAASRPTAVNLFWAIERMRQCHAKHRNDSTQRAAAALLDLARQIHHDDIEICRAIGAPRRAADRRRRAHHDPLQCRRARHRRPRHGAWA